MWCLWAAWQTFAEVAAVSPDPVRISVTDRTHGGQIPTREVCVNVQGRRGDELILLVWGRSMVWFPNQAEPVEDRDKHLLAAIRVVPDLLQQYLAARGYEVRRGGTYGLPQDIQIIRGVLEVLEWVPQDAGYIVRLKERPPEDSGPSGEADAVAETRDGATRIAETEHGAVSVTV